MKIRKLLPNKRLLTGILAVINLGILFYYTICDTACLYLKGDLAGLDMKYAGALLMFILLLLIVLNKPILSLVLLSVGVGGEIFLVVFQIKHATYCPYCLAFGVVLLTMLAINFNKRHIPLMALSLLLGLLVFLFAFSGSVTPAFAGESTPATFGSGPVRVRLYTDYFCVPCRAVEPEIEAVLSDLLQKNAIRLTLVDTPVHKETPLYARYFLYLLHENQPGFVQAFQIRSLLFEAASQNINAPAALEDFLTKKGLKFRPYDVMATFKTLDSYIREDKIRSTPSCAVQGLKGKEVFVGGANIIKGLKGILDPAREKKPH